MATRMRAAVHTVLATNVLGKAASDARARRIDEAADRGDVPALLEELGAEPTILEREAHRHSYSALHRCVPNIILVTETIELRVCSDMQLFWARSQSVRPRARGRRANVAGARRRHADVAEWTDEGRGGHAAAPGSAARVARCGAEATQSSRP